MSLDHLPASAVTLYAEALEQALTLERSAPLAAAPPGSLVSKTVGGSDYLYWQLSAGENKWQSYLGPDTPDLRAAIESLQTERRSQADDRAALDRMGQMLIRGGFRREPTPVATVLALLSGLGLFRRGAVLVGTQAFRSYASHFGVHFAEAVGPALNGDITHDLTIAAASFAEAPTHPGAESIADGLARLRFLPVPGLDPSEATVCYKVRGQDLRVDFLTTASAAAIASTGATSPAAPVKAARKKSTAVPIPSLGLSAQPLEFLDYLLEADPTPALALSRHATLIRLPDPARFALHKLWTAHQRPTSQTAKARRDRHQATTLLELLVEERPVDLETAWKGLGKRAEKKVIAGEIGKLREGLREALPFRVVGA